MKINENHCDKMCSTDFKKTLKSSEFELLFDVGWTRTTIPIDDLITEDFDGFGEIIDDHKGAIEILSDERNFSGFDFIKFRRAVKEPSKEKRSDDFLYETSI